MRILLLLVAGFLLSSSSYVGAWQVPSTSFRYNRVSARRKHQGSSVSLNERINDDDSFDISIRNAEFTEMTAASKLMVSCFYDPKSSWKQLYRIGELNRLQNNFPYEDQNQIHCMLVAVAMAENSGEPEVVGFVDTDGRPPKLKSDMTPRPYLSDLAVDPKWRRRGIARALVERCEQFVTKHIQQEHLYIRVKECNNAAIKMYSSMGYTTFSRERDSAGGSDLLLLRKDLSSSEETNVEETNAVETNLVDRVEK